MRSSSLVTLLTATTLLAGCVHKPAGYVGGSALALAGGALVIEAEGDNCSEREFGESIGCGIGNVFTGSAGVTMLAIGVGILLVTAMTPSPEAEAEAAAAPAPAALVTFTPAPVAAPASLEPPTTDHKLRQLTLQAMVAAGAGQCIAVEAIARHVETLDPRYRNEGFLADPAIGACLP